jgi:hypothetical protein
MGKRPRRDLYRLARAGERAGQLADHQMRRARSYLFVLGIADAQYVARIL